jgi:hypothetical protein
LKKALYGLKHVLHAWYENIDGYLMSLGFNKSVVDPNLYYNIVGDECLILVLFVDDLFLTGSESLIVECKRVLAYEFEMKDLGIFHYFLGLEVWQRNDEILLSQGKYTVEILKKLGMTDYKPMATPMVMNLKKLNETSSDSGEIDPHLYRQLIGSLMYQVNTKPDICYAVSLLGQFTSQLRQTHWIAAKHVLRYLRSTVGYGLRYASDVDMRLQGYADADWEGSAVDRKSTFGCCFTLGSAMVSWCSRKQTSVALSTTEAEYIALCVAVREAVWLHKLLANLFGHEMDSTVIHCDNQSCVKLSKNHVFHDNSKHIEIKHHYIRDMVQRKEVHVQYLSTHKQVTNVFTKPLARTKFKYFRERLGLVENASLAKGMLMIATS